MELGYVLELTKLFAKAQFCCLQSPKIGFLNCQKHSDSSAIAEVSQQNSKTISMKTPILIYTKHTNDLNAFDFSEPDVDTSLVLSVDFL